MTIPLIEACARVINPRAWDDDYWAQVGAKAEQESAQQTARHRAHAVIPLVLDAAAEVADRRGELVTGAMIRRLKPEAQS